MMSVVKIEGGYKLTDRIEERRASEITDMVNRAYWNQQKLFFEEGEGALRTSEREIKELLRDPEKKLFVMTLEKTDRIAGTILYQDLGEEVASFGLFAVDPELKGQGIGEKLMKVVEKEALRAGKRVISIEILSLADRLLNYYQKHGYETTGAVHPFFEVSRAKLKPGFEKASYLQAIKLAGAA